MKTMDYWLEELTIVQNELNLRNKKSGFLGVPTQSVVNKNVTHVSHIK